MRSKLIGAVIFRADCKQAWFWHDGVGVRGGDYTHCFLTYFDEEIHLDDLAVNKAINDDDSPTLTASSESFSEMGETNWSADELSRFYLCILKQLAHVCHGV